MTIIGAYLSASTLRKWTFAEAKQQLGLLQGYGINTIFSESDIYRQDIIQQTHDTGMQFMGGLTCFHSNQSHHLEHHPILANGEPRPKMNWYTGINPTHKDYNDTRLTSLGAMLQGNELDGVWLDFIRWSLHWEQELRADTPAPLESSFDAHTLKRFATFADLELPTGTTQTQSDWIIKHHLDTWVEFKCKIITDFVTEAQAIIQAQSHVKPLGIAIVPASPVERKWLLGQDVHKLSQLVDYISPMLYHHVLGKPATWIVDKLDEIARDSHVPLLPYLQVTVFGDNDRNFPTQEWETILDTVLTHKHTVGFIAFTGDALSINQRGQGLQQILQN